MGDFEILDHTADIAIKINGSNLHDLFTQAFLGLIAITELDNSILEGDESVYEIKTDGMDKEELLVKFINELIRVVQEMTKAPLSISDLSVSDTSLKCSLMVRNIKEFPDGYVELKSATYHMLDITDLDGELTATCVIDI